MAEERRNSLVPFFVMWTGQAFSLFGSQLVQFALIWWLTRETGSATVLAVASLVGLLPQVFLGPLAGTLVDRWNRRMTMMAADGAVALATLGLIYLFWTGQAQVWQVYLIMFVRSLAGSFHWPAMSASTSLMVPEKHLSRVQGLNQALNGAMNIVSAPLGAVLLGLLPMAGVLSIDVLTALIAILSLAFIHVPQPAATSESSEADLPQPSFWAELRLGFRYVWGWPGLLLILLMATVLNLLLNPGFSLVPLLVTEHFQGGALQLGWLESALGVGIVIGGLVLSVWGGFRRRIVTSLSGMLVLGAGVLLLGLTPASLFIMAVAAHLIIGLTIPMINGPLQAVVQVVVAPEIQGRVFSLMGSLAMAMTPLGLIVAGPLADVIGIRTWYLIAGTGTLIMGAAGFLVPAIMNVEQNGHQPTAAQGPLLPADETAGVTAADGLPG